MRQWFARKLFQWSWQVQEDWHDVTLTGPDGTKITFGAYQQWAASWPAGWEFHCSCEDAPETS